MANTSADRSSALDTIEAILEATNGSTTTTKVLWGGAAAIPIGVGLNPFATVEFGGEDEKEETFGNVMVWHTFEIGLHWPVSPEEAVAKTRLLAIWNACRDVQGALRADSTLGEKVSGMQIGIARLELTEIAVPGANGGSIPLESLRFTLRLQELEGEAVAR